MKLNLGVGEHRADGYLNLDTHRGPYALPDIVAMKALPFRDGAFDRVICSHVLEHVLIGELPSVLGEVRRVMAPGARLLAAGPDCWRVIRRWRDGLEPWSIVESCMEHRSLPGEHPQGWYEEGHAWNCHEERLVAVLEMADFRVVRRFNIEVHDVPLDGWPEPVGVAPWWCAVEVER